MKNKTNHLILLLIIIVFSSVACAPNKNSSGNSTPTVKSAGTTDQAINKDSELPRLSGLLVRISRNVSRSFSAPYAATFRWQVNDEQTVSVSGYACRALLIIDGDTSALNKAGEAIRKEGFSNDQYNTSETMLGYIKGRTVIQAVVLGDPTMEQRCPLVIRIGTI